jgi:hypothetical protein
LGILVDAIGRAGFNVPNGLSAWHGSPARFVRLAASAGGIGKNRPSLNLYNSLFDNKIRNFWLYFVFLALGLLYNMARNVSRVNIS